MSGALLDLSKIPPFKRAILLQSDREGGGGWAGYYETPEALANCIEQWYRPGWSSFSIHLDLPVVYSDVLCADVIPEPIVQHLWKTQVIRGSDDDRVFWARCQESDELKRVEDFGDLSEVATDAKGGPVTFFLLDPWTRGGIRHTDVVASTEQSGKR